MEASQIGDTLQTTVQEGNCTNQFCYWLVIAQVMRATLLVQ